MLKILLPLMDLVKGHSAQYPEALWELTPINLKLAAHDLGRPLGRPLASAQEQWHLHHRRLAQAASRKIVDKIPVALHASMQGRLLKGRLKFSDGSLEKILPKRSPKFALSKNMLKSRAQERLSDWLKGGIALKAFVDGRFSSQINAARSGNTKILQVKWFVPDSDPVRYPKTTISDRELFHQTSRK